MQWHAFQEDGVLQENLILHALKGDTQASSVMISTNEGPDEVCRTNWGSRLLGKSRRCPVRYLLVPNEHYVLVKRFSAKEGKKRLVAVVYDADRLPGVCVGFGNHLNYFHQRGCGLSLALAKGLAAFLSWTP